MKQKMKVLKKFGYSWLFPVFLLAVFVFIACSDPGNGTPTDQEDILIYSLADMAKIGVDSAYPLSASYILANDITLTNHIPIGTATTPFTGKFLGNGKTVTLDSFSSTAVSSNTYLGIFAFVKGASASSKALIKNLTINSSVNISEGGPATNIGLVAGYAENVEMDTITLSGIFAYATTVTTTQLLGGLVGLSTDGTIIKNCNSSLEMNISPGGQDRNAQYSYIGGFAGQFKNGAGIENCHNTGDVISRGIGQTFVGGITGGSIYAMNTAYQGYIQDSSSTGTIIGQNGGYWTFAGGIAGTIVGGTVNNINATTRIVRCFATGSVTAETGASYRYAGGIVGYNYYGALVSQCYFDGTVANGGGITSYNSQATAPHNSRIEDCWTGGSATSGISAQNQVNASIRRCYSIAVVTVGIASTNASASTGNEPGTITDCVAMNASISGPGRIIGTLAGTVSNNWALPNLESTRNNWAATARREPEQKDGGDIAAQYMSNGKPTQAFYVEVLNWDFTTVWKMGPDGYPKLQWQQ
jgi:hypothetical protein